jgi:hypothetical protein
MGEELGRGRPLLVAFGQALLSHAGGISRDPPSEAHQMKTSLELPRTRRRGNRIKNSLITVR